MDFGAEEVWSGYVRHAESRERSSIVREAEWRRDMMVMKQETRTEKGEMMHD